MKSSFLLYHLRNSTLQVPHAQTLLLPNVFLVAQLHELLVVHLLPEPFESALLDALQDHVCIEEVVEEAQRLTFVFYLVFAVEDHLFAEIHYLFLQQSLTNLFLMANLPGDILVLAGSLA